MGGLQKKNIHVVQLKISHTLIQWQYFDKVIEALSGRSGNTLKNKHTVFAQIDVAPRLVAALEMMLHLTKSEAK